MRIATYNLLHGMSARSGLPDLGAAVTTIAALQADVVAVQEADRGLERSGGVHQVAWLADQLAWTYAFAPALLGDPETAWTTVGARDPGGGAYGVGVLSRYPLRRVVRHQLPGGRAGRRTRRATLGRPGWDREPRVALSAEVAVPDGAITVTTAHLSYLPWRGLAQLRRVAAIAAAQGETVLAGDLNLPVHAVRMALGGGWRHAHGGPTHPAWSPRRQPDQIVVTKDLRVRDAVVGPAGASDHLPLVATIDLP
ncbi:MAG: endonuclease/exonuclease/phosphatase family protein [Egibacteraceae bacterium]